MNRVMAILGLCALIAASSLADAITNSPNLMGTTVVTRVGYIAEFIVQHSDVTVPSIDGKQEEAQFSFDIGERPMQTHQIIVVHPVKMQIPTERGRKLELKGTAGRISLKGGETGKAGYENEVFYLKTWRYLQEKPSQPGPRDGATRTAQDP